MIITLDASAAVEVVMHRPRSQDIVPVLVNADWIIAPTLYIYETANVLWKYNSLSNIPANDLNRHMGWLLELVDEYVEARTLCEEALALGSAINHPVYDAIYLVTSRRKNAALLTLDTRLSAAAEKSAIPVVSL